MWDFFTCFLTSLILFRLFFFSLGNFELAEHYSTAVKDGLCGSFWVQAPTLPLISFMSLSKLPNLFMSQFPHLENGVNHKVYPYGLL